MTLTESERTIRYIERQKKQRELYHTDTEFRKKRIEHSKKYNQVNKDRIREYQEIRYRDHPEEKIKARKRYNSKKLKSLISQYPCIQGTLEKTDKSCPIIDERELLKIKAQYHKYLKKIEECDKLLN